MFFGTKWLQDGAGQEPSSTNSTQTFGKNFNINPEKVYVEKSILDRQEQNQEQILGNRLFSSRLCLLEASRGMAPLREDS